MFVTQKGWQEREGRDRYLRHRVSTVKYVNVRTLSTTLGSAGAHHDPHPSPHGRNPTPTSSSASIYTPSWTLGTTLCSLSIHAPSWTLRTTLCSLLAYKTPPGHWQILSTTLGSLVAHALASTHGRTLTVLSSKVDVRLITTPDFPPTTCRSSQTASTSSPTRPPASPTRLSRPLVRAPHRRAIFYSLASVLEPRVRN
jgi:hypothetical protein